MGRECGSCAACCKVPEIEEPDWSMEGEEGLMKAPFTWCRFARPGYEGSCCSIYAHRPKTCVDFTCMWLTNPRTMPEWLRPNRSHVCFVADEILEDGRKGVQVWEMVPGALSQRRIVEWMKQAQDRNGLVFKFGNIWKVGEADLDPEKFVDVMEV